MQMDNFIRRHPQYYISELVDKVAEYRVFIVQGRVACVARKTPGNPREVAWNVAQGGRFDHVRWDDWPLQAVRKSVEAFNLSGLDFGGVDVMVDSNDRSYIIEINSAPSLPLMSNGEPTHRQECMAKCFDWIIRNGKERIPLVERRGGYRKFIHPAICDRAEVE
jgi:glutathione synthase/RimK-type ligase-like ATP-grasp enzyme